VNRLDPLYIVLAGVTAPIWARNARGGWPERFGRTAPIADRAGSGGEHLPRLLLHAVSVGEVNAIRELVPLLTPEVHVIVSVSTDTGLKRAREVFAGAGGSAAKADVVRYPLDFSWAVRRFLDAVRPDVVALTELELWPNFVGECVRRGVPVGVINGRLSARSFKGYRKLRRFFRPVFSALEFAAVQDDAYAERFEYMGVDPGRCVIAGSMKWDTARIEDDVPGAEDLAHQMGVARGPGAPPLIVAGSTAEGEEALLHRVCGELGDVQLLCAPRKPERFDDAAAAMPGCRRRSRGAGGGGQKSGGGGEEGQSERPPRRFLLDTIGELRKAYALADVVVMGRTFGKLYGSDPVEPIGLGKATVVGPAMSDFEQIFRAFEAAGGIVQTTEAELARVLGELLRDEGRRRELAERGRACIREHQGASARHAELLLSLVRR
jgi:3-deoxy-D-manno-octulosonic-acid transferase